jgi:hypothetical protein
MLFAVAMLAWSTPAAAQEELRATLVGVEESLWEAWKNADLDVFRANLVEDAVNNGANGVTVGRDQMIGFMEQYPCDVESYALSDVQLHQLSSDTALLTYRAEQSATCGGEVLPTPVWVSSVYVNEDGQWKSALYQETPAAPAG